MNPASPLTRALALAGLVAVSVSSLPAADYFLQQNHFSPNHWETVASTNGWRTAATGGSQLATFDSSGNYFNNGFTIFTRNAAGDTFTGNSLTLAGGKLELRYGDANANASIGNLIIGATGSSIGTNNPTNTIGAGLSVTNLTVNGTLTFGVDNFRRVRLAVGTLTGSANITTSGGSGSRSVFSATNALGYTGNILHSQGRLDFNNDLISSGGLSLSSGAELILDQNLTFTSVSIGGSALTAGTYTFSNLNTTYDAYFMEGGSGSITVAPIPEPATFAILGGVIVLGFAASRRHRRQID